MYSAVEKYYGQVKALLRTLRALALPALSLVLVAPAFATASYLVSANRIGTNFYSLENNPTLLYTQFCSEDALRSPAYLTMSAADGNLDGQIRFKETGTVCDVKAAYLPLTLEQGPYSARLNYLGTSFYLDTLKKNLIRTNPACEIFYQQQAQFTVSILGSTYANGVALGKITFPDNAFYASCNMLGVYELRDLTGAAPPLVPLQISNVRITDTAQITTTLRATSNNDATAYVVVYDGNEPNANNKQILAGLDNKDNAARFSTNVPLKADVDTRISLFNLTPGNEYKACISLVNEWGTLSQAVCTVFTTEWPFLPGAVIRSVPASDSNTVNRFPLFSVNYYLMRNGDVAKNLGTTAAAATKHWLENGLSERRESSLYFDPIWYLQRNQDLIMAFGGDGVSAATHFAQSGLSEGREASPVFSVQEYKARNPDLVAAFGENNASYFTHFENNGARECRVASRYFDVKYYLAANPDLAVAFKGNCAGAFVHWINLGRNEGRKAAPNQKPLAPR